MSNDKTRNVLYNSLAAIASIAWVAGTSEYIPYIMWAIGITAWVWFNQVGPISFSFKGLWVKTKKFWLDCREEKDF